MKNIIKTLLNEYLDLYDSIYGFDEQYCDKAIMESTQEQEAVGVLIKATDTNKVLLLLRNDKVPKWSLMSGTMEKGEKPLETLKREIKEEMQISDDIISNIEFKKIRSEHITIPEKINDDGEVIPEKNRIFHYFQGFINSEFEPNLQNDPAHENLNYKWVSLDNLPSPLYPGLEPRIKAMLKDKKEKV